MKKLFVFVAMAMLLGVAANAQDRYRARGADSGELYMAGNWYALYDWGGHPHYKDMQRAIFRLTENGKKLTIQYDVSRLYSDLETTPVPDFIYADATQGVVYMKTELYKNGSDYTSLWVSFDYGENWTFREENIERQFYSSVNVEGIIYRGRYNEIFKSEDYGNIFTKTEYWVGGSEPGLQYGEGFSVATKDDTNQIPARLVYSCDFGQNYMEIPIGDEFEVYDPDVYRGGLPGEVYIYSWFREIDQHQTFRALFSADTGRTYRPVYVSEPHSPYSFFDKPKPIFMSDREPGVFYIIKNYMVEDLDDLFGWYLKPCIYYYRDYGEILEGVFCHDLVRDYEYVEIPCEHTTDLVLEVINQNAIHLQWSNVADNIRGYHVFRNDTRITNEMLTDTFYLDENLPGGEYEYYVRAYYEYDCPSDSSNHVFATIAVGIKEMRDRIVVYPNPTGGELTIRNYELGITNVEVFDLMGRAVGANLCVCPESNVINISHLPAGMYFVRIQTDKGTTTKKIIKK